MDHKKEITALDPVLTNFNAHKVDFLTPHKVSVVLLVHHYLKAKHEAVEAGTEYSPSARRRFCMLLLKLIQCPEMSYKELHTLLTSETYKIEPALLDNFEKCMVNLTTHGIEQLFDAFDMQTVTEKMGSDSCGVSQYGIAGLYIRRTIVTFDRMTFPEVMALYKTICLYHEKGVRALALCPSSSQPEDESFMDSQTYTKDRKPSNKWSVKQAELFISQQSSLLESNELRALPPVELQTKLNDIAQDNPLFSQIHFLSYMNNLRLRDFFSSLDALHRSFDRSPVQTFNPVESRGFQYASLNLAILHANFDHKQEALSSLKESIMLAQEAGDRHCLELANAWYCILNNGKIKPTEKCIPDMADITMIFSFSLSIQFIVKTSALCGYVPSDLFNLMLKSDELNYRNSIMELVANGLAQRAALWTLYGKNEIASLCSQLLLKLNKSWAFGDIGNSESVCHVLCCLALWLSVQGEFPLCAVVLHHAKERFRRDPLARNWMICDCYVTIQQSIYKGKWDEGMNACSQLYIFDKHASILQRASLCIARRNIRVAQRLLENLLKQDNLDALTRVRALILQAHTMIGPNEISTNVVKTLSIASNCAKEKHLEYEESIIDMMYAHVFLYMKMPNKSLQIIKSCMDNILANGGIYDRAKTAFLFAKCLVAATDSKEDKISRMSECMDMINEAIEFFMKLEAHSKVMDVYVYLARFYNEVDLNNERNKYASLFRQYHLQFPTAKEYFNVFY